MKLSKEDMEKHAKRGLEWMEFEEQTGSSCIDGSWGMAVHRKETD